jgi:hypothetical protein
MQQGNEGGLIIDGQRAKTAKEPARKFAGTSLGSHWTLLERFIETG